MNTTTHDEAVEADASAAEDFRPSEGQYSAAAYPVVGDQYEDDEDDSDDVSNDDVNNENVNNNLDSAFGDRPIVDEEQTPESDELLNSESDSDSDPDQLDNQPMLGVAQVPEVTEADEGSAFAESSEIPEAYAAPVLPEADEDAEDSEELDAFEAPALAGVADPIGSDLDAPAESTAETPLLDAEISNGLLSRWTEVQIAFVEDPRTSVREADTLLREMHEALIAASAERLDRLAEGWNEESDTEQLRLALRQYRSFIGVLLPN